MKRVPVEIDGARWEALEVVADHIKFLEDDNAFWREVDAKGNRMICAMTNEIEELKRQLHLERERNQHILNTREQLAGIQPRRNHAETLLQTDAGE